MRLQVEHYGGVAVPTWPEWSQRNMPPPKAEHLSRYPPGPRGMCCLLQTHARPACLRHTLDLRSPYRQQRRLLCTCRSSGPDFGAGRSLRSAAITAPTAVTYTQAGRGSLAQSKIARPVESHRSLLVSPTLSVSLFDSGPPAGPPNNRGGEGRASGLR